MLRFTRSEAANTEGGWHKRAGMMWLFGWVALGGLLLSVPPMRSKESERAPSPRTAAPTSAHKAPTRHTKNIEDLVPGDLVMAEDEATGKFVPKRVVQVFRNRADHLRLVAIRSADGSRQQELKTTNEHPFYIHGEGWVPASRLRPGQKVVQSDGMLGTIVFSAYEAHPEGIAVFNFEVEDVHNYFVAQDLADLPILVHNACQPRNAHLAGGEHPKTGVPFDADGYPDFSKWATKTVNIEQTGSRGVDFRMANEAAGLSETPSGYTWYHHKDGTTMQLVPRNIHAKTGHSGGVSIINNGG
jgi:hypothetical protein